MRFFKPVAILGVMTALAGCVVVESSTLPGTSPGPVTPGPVINVDNAKKFDGTYRLVDIDGRTIPGTANLNIEGQAINGQGPCNYYSTQNNGSWPQVVMGAITWTQRACLTEGGETQFSAALEQVTQANLQGDRLELLGPAHTMLFIAE